MNRFLRGLTACFLFLGVLCSSLFGQVPYGKALKAKRNGQAKLFATAGVVGAGVSFDGNGQAQIKVFVKNAKVRGIPKQIDGVPVVVAVSGEFSAYDEVTKQAPGGKKGKPGDGGDAGDNPRARFERAVPIGVSIGSTGPNICFAGTLGCRVKLVNLSTGNATYYILSNNHVIADENNGQVGVDKVIQPGTLDNNCVLDPNDIIGTLSDFEPITFDGSANGIDAAIALTTTAETGFATPPTIYGAPSSVSETATVGLLVKKFGRTTGLTEGIVDAINVDVNVGYDAGTAWFEDQIVITGQARRGKKVVATSFSDGGDSGSLIVTQDGNKPVGLLFAGNSSFTIANPIDRVLDRFSDLGAGLMMVVDDGN